MANFLTQFRSKITFIEYLRKFTTILSLFTLLVFITNGCQIKSAESDSETGASTVSLPDEPENKDTSPTPASTSIVSNTDSQRYKEAIEKGYNASQFAQSATSNDDWKLVASRWQQAIKLMATVQKTSPLYHQAQGKIAEYNRNFVYAQKQTNQPVIEPEATISVKSILQDETENNLSDLCSNLENQYEVAKAKYNAAAAKVEAFSFEDKFGGFAIVLSKAKAALAEANLELSEVRSQYDQNCS